MPLDPAAAQALLVARVGDIDPETAEPTRSSYGLVATNVAALWDAYADKAAQGPRLQELYARRDALDLVLGRLNHLVDTSLEGESIKWRQRVDGYRAKFEAVQAELERLELQLARRRVPVAGRLTASRPVDPPAAGPDASDPRYSGWPYLPRPPGEA